MNNGVLRRAALGVALLAVAIAASIGVVASFTGHFSTYDVVYADIPASGTGISSGSVVLYRDITVGSVGSLGHVLPNGLLRVQLHMTPSDLDAIPPGVTADVEIATIFGTQGINLVPPAKPQSGHLQVGQTIGSVPVSTTTTLQGDATDLDNLLKALHPAALDETLTAIATALRHQGPQLGVTIDQLATYINEMLPELPNLVNDVNRFGPVTTTLSQAAPDLITTLSNGSVLATTISDDAEQLHEVLSGGTPTLNDVTGLIQNSEASFEDLIANSAVLLGDVAANPNFVADTLTGFDNWSKAFSAAESKGPYLSFAGAIQINGSAQLVAAALGVPGSNQLVEQGLGAQYFNPPTYTSADCPTYAGEQGPNCAQAKATAPASSAGSKGSTAGAVAVTPAQQAAAVKIATSLDSGRAPPSPAVTTLLLEPLLVHLAKVP
jgi:virulence factor Mce-like protein